MGTATVTAPDKAARSHSPWALRRARADLWRSGRFGGLAPATRCAVWVACSRGCDAPSSPEAARRRPLGQNVAVPQGASRDGLGFASLRPVHRGAFKTWRVERGD